MSWYSGSHDTSTSSSTASSAASAMASRFAHTARWGSTTPFGSDVDPLVNCRMAFGSRVGCRRDEGCIGDQVGEQHHRRIARLGRHEGREVRVGDHERDVGVEDASTGLVHELVERPHAHRQRQHHDGGAGEPDGLDAGDERPGRGAEECDVVAGSHAPLLQGGSHRRGVTVDLGPRDGDVDVAGHEGHVVATGRPCGDPGGERVGGGAGGAQVRGTPVPTTAPPCPLPRFAERTARARLGP